MLTSQIQSSDPLVQKNNQFPTSCKSFIENDLKDLNVPYCDFDGYCEVQIQKKKLTESLLLQEVPNSSLPHLMVTNLLTLRTILEFPRTFIANQVKSTFSLSDLFLNLLNHGAIDEIEIIGGEVGWILSSHGTNITYLERIVKALQIDDYPREMVENFSKKSADLDFRIIINSAKNESHESAYKKLESVYQTLINFIERGNKNLNGGFLKKKFLALPPNLYAEIGIHDIKGNAFDFFITTKNFFERESLFLKDAMRLSIKPFLIHLSDAQKSGKKAELENFKLYPQSDCETRGWQPFFDRLIGLIRAKNPETINESGWSLVISDYLKGKRGVESDLETILWRTFQTVFSKTNPKFSLSTSLLAKIEEKQKSGGSDQELFAFVLAWYLNKAVNNHHFSSPNATVAIFLQATLSIKLQGIQNYEIYAKHLWRELQELQLKVVKTKKATGIFAVIKEILDIDPLQFDTALSLLESKSFASICNQLICKKEDAPKESHSAYFVKHNLKPWIHLYSEDIYLLLPLDPLDATKRLLKGWQAAPENIQKLLAQASDALPLIQNNKPTHNEKHPFLTSLKIDEVQLEILCNFLEQKNKNSFNQLYGRHFGEILLTLQTHASFPLDLTWIEDCLIHWLKSCQNDQHSKNLLATLSYALGNTKNLDTAKAIDKMANLLKSTQALPQICWMQALAKAQSPDKAFKAFWIYQSNNQFMNRLSLENRMDFAFDLAHSRPDLAISILNKENLDLRKLTLAFSNIYNIIDKDNNLKEVYCSNVKNFGLQILRQSEFEKTFLNKHLNALDWLIQQSISDKNFSDAYDLIDLVSKNECENKSHLEILFLKWIQGFIDKENWDFANLVIDLFQSKVLVTELNQDLKSKINQVFSKSSQEQKIKLIELLLDTDIDPKIEESFVSCLKEFFSTILKKKRLTDEESKLGKKIVESNYFNKLLETEVGTDLPRVFKKVFDSITWTNPQFTLFYQKFDSRLDKDLRRVLLFVYLGKKNIEFPKEFNDQLIFHFSIICEKLCAKKLTAEMSILWAQVEKKKLTVKWTEPVALVAISYFNNAESTQEKEKALWKNLDYLREIFPSDQWKGLIPKWHELIFSSSIPLDKIEIAKDLITKDNLIAKEWNAWLKAAQKIPKIESKICEDAVNIFYASLRTNQIESTSSSKNEIMGVCLELVQFIAKINNGNVYEIMLHNQNQFLDLIKISGAEKFGEAKLREQIFQILISTLYQSLKNEEFSKRCAIQILNFRQRISEEFPFLEGTFQQADKELAKTSNMEVNLYFLDKYEELKTSKFLNKESLILKILKNSPKLTQMEINKLLDVVAKFLKQSKSDRILKAFKTSSNLEHFLLEEPAKTIKILENEKIICLNLFERMIKLNKDWNKKNAEQFATILCVLTENDIELNPKSTPIYNAYFTNSQFEIADRLIQKNLHVHIFEKLPIRIESQNLARQILSRLNKLSDALDVEDCIVILFILIRFFNDDPGFECPEFKDFMEILKPKEISEQIWLTAILSFQDSKMFPVFWKGFVEGYLSNQKQMNGRKAIIFAATNALLRTKPDGILDFLENPNFLTDLKNDEISFDIIKIFMNFGECVDLLVFEWRNIKEMFSKIPALINTFKEIIPHLRTILLETSPSLTNREDEIFNFIELDNLKDIALCRLYGIYMLDIRLIRVLILGDDQQFSLGCKKLKEMIQKTYSSNFARQVIAHSSTLLLLINNLSLDKKIELIQEVTPDLITKIATVFKDKSVELKPFSDLVIQIAQIVSNAHLDVGIKFLDDLNSSSEICPMLSQFVLSFISQQCFNPEQSKQLESKVDFKKTLEALLTATELNGCLYSSTSLQILERADLREDKKIEAVKKLIQNCTNRMDQQFESLNSSEEKKLNFESVRDQLSKIFYEMSSVINLMESLVELEKDELEKIKYITEIQKYFLKLWEIECKFPMGLQNKSLLISLTLANKKSEQSSIICSSVFEIISALAKGFKNVIRINPQLFELFIKTSLEATNKIFERPDFHKHISYGILEQACLNLIYFLKNNKNIDENEIDIINCIDKLVFFSFPIKWNNFKKQFQTHLREILSFLKGEFFTTNLEKNFSYALMYPPYVEFESSNLSVLESEKLAKWVLDAVIKLTDYKTEINWKVALSKVSFLENTEINLIYRIFSQHPFILDQCYSILRDKIPSIEECKNQAKLIEELELMLWAIQAHSFIKLARENQNFPWLKSLVKLIFSIMRLEEKYSEIRAGLINGLKFVWQNGEAIKKEEHYMAYLNYLEELYKQEKNIEVSTALYTIFFLNFNPPRKTLESGRLFGEWGQLIFNENNTALTPKAKKTQLISGNSEKGII